MMKSLRFKVGIARALSKVLACFFLLSAHNLAFGINVEKFIYSNIIGVGQLATLEIEVTNNNGIDSDAGSLVILDNLPPGVVVSEEGVISIEPDCGTLTAVPGTTIEGSSVIHLTGGTVEAGETCDVVIGITSNTVGPYTNTIMAGQVSYEINFAQVSGNEAEASFTVLASPVMTKSFMPSKISPNQSSLLTITVNSLNGQITPIDGIFDDLPEGVTIVAPAATLEGCGAAAVLTADVGDDEIELIDGVIAAGGACIIKVNVTSQTLGRVTNSVFAVLNETTVLEAKAPLEVSLTPAIAPEVTKKFEPSKISPNQSSVLTITVKNPNEDATATDSLDITDTLPAGVTIVSPPAATPVGCGTAIFTAVNGTNLITLTDGEIAAGATCTIRVNVTSATLGLVTNNVTATYIIGTDTLSSTASAGLSVTSSPTIGKKFIPNEVDDCGCSTLVITLTNASSLPATLITNFVDRLPPGLKTIGFGNTTCPGGSVDLRNSRVTLGAGAVIPANGFCTVSVDVESQCNGEFTNRISAGALQTTNGNNLEGATASVNFCCEDLENDRETCLAQNTIDEEEDMSLYIE